MDIRFVSSLTPDDEDRLAKVLVQIVGSLLDRSSDRVCDRRPDKRREGGSLTDYGTGGAAAKRTPPESLARREVGVEYC